MINIKIDLPQKISANGMYAGMHWSKRKRIADLYHKYMRAYQFIIDPAEYPIDVTYIFRFKSRPLDVSNCFAMVKLLEDGMVKSKSLKNDTPEYVQSITVHSMKAKKDEVEIIIT